MTGCQAAWSSVIEKTAREHVFRVCDAETQTVSDMSPSSSKSPGPGRCNEYEMRWDPFVYILLETTPAYQPLSLCWMSPDSRSCQPTSAHTRIWNISEATKCFNFATIHARNVTNLACLSASDGPVSNERKSRTPCKAESHAPATQKARSPRDARGTPETYITPLAEQKVARLPRWKGGGAQGTPEGRQRRTSRPLQSRKSRAIATQKARSPIDARGTPETYIAPLAEAESRAPATQKARSPRDARGTPEVHHAPLQGKVTPEGRQRRTSRPLQSRKSRACHAKGPEPKGRQRDARDVHRAPCRAESHAPATQKARSPRDARGTPETYIAPLAEQKVARLPRKRPGAQGTPEGRQRRTSRPFQTQSRAPATQKAPEPKGRQMDARGVHPAPCRAESHAPATQKARSPRDARGTPETYITPLAEQKVARLPRKRPGAQGTPEGRQRRTSRPLQSRKSRACHAKGCPRDARTPERTSRPLQSRKSHACQARSPRDARGTPETYITPLAEQKVARLPRKRRRSPRDARGTPETYITPLAEQKVARLPRKRPGAQGTPEGRQRRTSRPLQSRKSRACHAKGGGAQGTPEGRQRRTSRPLQSRKSRACHAKGPEPKGRQRDARDVHHAPCRAESRAPATQKARSPRDARGTPETYIAPLAEQKVARLPRKRPGAQGTPEGRQRRTSRAPCRAESRAPATQKARSPRDARGRPETYIPPLAEAESRAPATQKARSPRDARGTPETYITPRLPEQKVARLPVMCVKRRGVCKGRQREWETYISDVCAEQKVARLPRRICVSECVWVSV